MASLQQIISWFQTGLFPTAEQFRQTWLSYWHKSEKIPQSQVFGLQDSLDTLSTGMIYKEPVQNLSDLATTYPNPQKGWSVQVINEKNADGNSLIYQWDGTQWNNTGMVGFPADTVKKAEVDEEVAKLGREMNIINCHLFQDEFTPFSSQAEARLLVPIDPIDGLPRRRRQGIIITYQLATGQWIFERRKTPHTTDEWYGDEKWENVSPTGYGFVKNDNFSRRVKWDKDVKQLTFPAGLTIRATAFPRKVITLDNDLVFDIPESNSSLYIKQSTGEIVSIADTIQDRICAQSDDYIQIGAVLESTLMLNGLSSYEIITSGKKVQIENKVRALGQDIFKFNCISSANFDGVLDIRAIVTNKRDLYHPNNKRKRFAIASYGSITGDPQFTIYVDDVNGNFDTFAYWRPTLATYPETSFSFGNSGIKFIVTVKDWPTIREAGYSGNIVGNILDSSIFNVVDNYSIDLTSDIDRKFNGVKSFEIGKRIGVFVGGREATFQTKFKLNGDITNSASETSSYPVLMRWAVGTTSADGIIADLRMRINIVNEYAYTPGVVEFLVYNFNENTDGAIVKRIQDNMLWKDGIFEKDLFSVRMKNPTTDDIGINIRIDNQEKTIKINTSANITLYSLNYSQIILITDVFEALKNILPSDKYELLSYGIDGYSSDALPSCKIGFVTNKAFYINDVSQGYSVPDSYPAFIPALDLNKEIDAKIIVRPDMDVEGGAIISYVINDYLLTSYAITPAVCAKFANKLTNVYLGRHSDTNTLLLNSATPNFFEYSNKAELPHQHIHYYLHNIYDTTDNTGLRYPEQDGVYLDINNNPANIPGLWPGNSHTTYGRFARLLKTLTEYGFTPLSASDESKCRRGEMVWPVSGKTFTLHFDDGQNPYNYPVIRNLFLKYGVKPIVHYNSRSLSGTVDFLTDDTLKKIHAIEAIGWEISYHGYQHHHVNYMTYQQLIDFLQSQFDDFQEKGISADKVGYAFSNPSKSNLKVYRHLFGMVSAYTGRGTNGTHGGVNSETSDGNTSSWAGERYDLQMRNEASDAALFDVLLPPIKGLR